MDFMGSVSARPLRILAEYFGPLKRLEDMEVKDTVVFFGSARIKSKKDAQLALKAAKTKAEREESARVMAMSKYYEEAKELARLLTTWTMAANGKTQQRYLICSGGGPGIMQAANEGAHQAKGMTVGLNIALPFEPNANPYITPDLNFEFHYFFMRKYWFAYMAKALVIFPGGFGTLDELFEVLTLIQTKKMTKPIPIVIYGSEYWKNVINLDEMVKWGTIAKKDLKLFHFSDDPEEASNYLKKRLISHYGK